MRQIVAIDFETGNYSRASAIAMGISIIQDGVVTETKSWLFRPPGPDIYIRRDFVALHGIRPEDLEDKPYFEDIWHHAAEDIDKSDWLLAHNARFDRNVLYAMAAYYEISLPKLKWQCTVNISRATWPDLVNHKLSTVCEHLGIPLKHHDPASDAEACANIYLRSNEEKCRQKASGN